MTPLDAIRAALDEEIRSWERRLKALEHGTPDAKREARVTMDRLEMVGEDWCAAENAIRALRHFETALGKVPA